MEETDDPVLRSLLEISVAAVREKREVFSIIDEPVLFKQFLEWTKTGIEEAQAAALALKQASDKASQPTA
jgi:hypothetical protein